MKKIFASVAAFFLIFGFTGCGSSPDTTEESIDGVPAWVVTMSKKSDTAHYEVGYGKMSNRATSQKKAESDARNKIAMWLQTDVQTALVTYTQDAGIGDETELIEFMEEISKQTADVSMSGADIEEVYVDEDGGVYVLMSYDINGLAADLQSQVDSYVRNESAAFAEFKADEALKALLSREAAASE